MNLLIADIVSKPDFVEIDTTYKASIEMEYMFMPWLEKESKTEGHQIARD